MNSSTLLAIFALLTGVAGKLYSYNMDITYRDFTPQTSSDYGRSSYSSDSNIPNSYLDQNYKPSMNGTHSTVKSLQSYSQWFRDTDKTNYHIPSTLSCQYDDSNGCTSYDNNNFFPIDNKGYGNYKNTGHNCHFSSECHHHFCHQPNTWFNVTCNSDIWVYINGILVIDFGGVSSTKTKSCSLDSLKLTVGLSYTISIFHANRDPSACHFGFKTNCHLNPQPDQCPPLPITSHAMTTKALTTHAKTTGAQTTQAKTTGAITSHAMPITSSKITSAALTTSAVSTSQITSNGLTTSFITTAGITSAGVTTNAVTSAPLTTGQMTSSEVTSVALTTSAVTSSKMTTSALTTAQVTSAQWTSAEMTTAEITSAEMTTAEITSAAITSAEMTTGADVTTADYTSAKITSADATTGADVTTGVDITTSSYPIPPPTSNTTNNTEPGRPGVICEVVFKDFCPGIALNDASCPDYPYLHFTNKNVSFDAFNAISFGNFKATNGDIEGRLAVRGSLNVAEYSVGYELRTGGVSAIDEPEPYSLVVGADATFTSGAVFPQGNGVPYAGEQELIFVAGTFTGPDYLRSEVRNEGKSSGALNSDFDAAKTYYTALSNAWANEPATGTVSFSSSGVLTVNCMSAAAESVVVEVSGTQISSTTSWVEVNCNAEAQIIFNIQGSEDFKFAGNNFYHRQEKVLYNVLGNGRTITAQTEVRGNLLAPTSILNQPSGVWKGIVIVANVVVSLQINRNNCTCCGVPPNPPNDTVLCPAFEGNCDGLIFPLGDGIFSFRDFNAISFDSFTGYNGDVQGRLAVRNNAYLGLSSDGNGFSVGDQLSTSIGGADNSLPFSLVVGRFLSFHNGRVFPDGSGVPYAGAEEYIFAGDDYSVDDYIAESITGDCQNRSGCLDAYFDAAQKCYGGFQTQLAGLADTVTSKIYWDGFFIECGDNTSSVYVVSVDGASMSTFTYWATNNCNFQASWVINVRGTGDFTFSGGSFPAVPAGVVYNVIGSGRTITVANTDLRGHLLAPYNNLKQFESVINGKVVVGNVTFCKQINREGQCPVPTNVTINSIVSQSSDSGSNTLYLVNPAGLRVGDTISDTSNQNYAVQSVNSNSVTVSPALSQSYQTQALFVTKTNSIYGRGTAKVVDTPNPAQPSETFSGAGSLAVSLLFVILALIA